jgi:membrane-associated phospholipid phosphatase
VNLGTKIKSFYNQYVTSGDITLMSLLLFTVLLSAGISVYNHFTYQFTGEPYLPLKWVELAPLAFAVWLFALYARDISPRTALFTSSYCCYFFIFLMTGITTTSLQYTPFPLIDQHLVHFDQALGFSTNALLNWTYAHPLIKSIFNYAYILLYVELIVLPIVISLLLQKRAINIFLLTLILSTLIGCTIYFFFPTAAPASVFHNSHFMTSQTDTYLKFFEAHHRLPLTTYAGGFIAFPSFHVCWACLLTYLSKNKRWLFIPLAVFNIIVILSTMFLGWHYLADVLGGFALAAISIAISNKIYDRWFVTTSPRANSAYLSSAVLTS